MSFMYDANNSNDAHLFHIIMPPVKESYDFSQKLVKPVANGHGTVAAPDL